MPLTTAGGRYWLLRAQVVLGLAWGRSAVALRGLDQLLQHWPRDPWALASRAVLLQRLGHPQAALIDARALVAAHPQRHAADWFNLGFLLEQQAGNRGELQAALQAFERACRLGPQLDRAWYGLALVALRLGEVVQAEQALRQVTRLQPMGPHAWYQLARLLAESGRLDEARAVICKLQGFEPAVARQLQRETGLAGAVLAQEAGPC